MKSACDLGQVRNRQKASASSSKDMRWGFRACLAELLRGQERTRGGQLAQCPALGKLLWLLSVLCHILTDGEVGHGERDKGRII